MSKREPVSINGQQKGRIKASWILFKEAWAYLRADKEIVWIPLITGLINLVLFGILVFAFVMMGGEFSLSAEGESSSPIELIFLFSCYIIGAFTLALSQSAITHTVYTRIHGGDATSGQALKTAFARWNTLLLWAIISSTVGIILRMFAERSRFLGKIVVWILGSAWSLMTYFVVPSIMIGKKSAFNATTKSAQIFKATWGETLVSNFSLGLTFFFAHLLVLASLIGLVIATAAMNSSILITVIFMVYGGWLVLAILVQSALEAVLKTLLYVYATEETPPPNFNQELLEKMFSRTNPTKIPKPIPPNLNTFA